MKLELKKEAKEEGRKWRLKKCGYDSHEMLLERFNYEMRIKDEKNEGLKEWKRKNTRRM